MCDRLSVAVIILVGIASNIQAQQITAPELKIPVGGIPSDFRMSSDGSRLAVATFKSRAFVFDLPKGEKVLEFGLHGHGARVALSPNGKQLAVSAADNRDVCIIDVASQKIVHRFPNRIGNHGQILFSATGNTLYVLQSEPGYEGIVSYSLPTRRLSRVFPAGLVYRESIFGMVIDHESSSVYYYQHFNSSTSQLQKIGGSINSYSGTRKLVRRDLKTGREKTIYFDRDGKDSRHDGIRLALSSDRKTIILDELAIDVSSGKVSDRFKNKYPAAEFSPDGKLLACSNGAGAEICDSTTGLRIGLLSKFTSRDVDNKYIPPIFSLDGSKVITSGDDESIWVWNITQLIKK